MCVAAMSTAEAPSHARMGVPPVLGGETWLTAGDAESVGFVPRQTSSQVVTVVDVLLTLPSRGFRWLWEALEEEEQKFICQFSLVTFANVTTDLAIKVKVETVFVAVVLLPS